MKDFLSRLAFIICIVFTILCSCRNRGPHILDYNNAGGYVIAKEICNADPARDYWLVDLTYHRDTPRYGDTISINNRTFTNVVKVKGLNAPLQQIDMTVSLDFKTITPGKVETIGCSIANPLTYRLRELFIIHQGELR